MLYKSEIFETRFFKINGHLDYPDWGFTKVKTGESNYF